MANSIVANAQVNIPSNQENNNLNQNIIQNAKIGFEGAILSEGQPENWAGKIINKIQEFLGFKHNWDEIERLSLETGLSRKQILETFGTYKTKMLQTYLTHLTNEAAFGITGESEFGKEQASKSVGGSLAYATAGLVGNLLGVEGGFKALSLFAKTAKYTAALAKIDTLLSDTKFVRWMATNDIQTNLFYRMVKEGAKWGTYGAVTSFIQNAPQYATVWQAFEKATPEAITNGLFGLGLPLVGAIKVADTFENPLIKAIWTMGLRGSAGIALMEGSELGSKILTGEGNLDITTLWNAVKAHDTLSALTSVMNLLFSAAIGLQAHHFDGLENVDPRIKSKYYIKDIPKDLDDILTNIDELSKTIEAQTSVKEPKVDTEAIKKAADLPKETEIKDISDTVKLINAKDKEGIILTQSEKPLTDLIKKPNRLFEQDKDIDQIFKPNNGIVINYNDKKQNHPQSVDIALNILNNKGYAFKGNEVDGLLRGNVPILNIEGKKYIFDLNDKFYPFVKKAVQKTLKKNVIAITKTVGDKYNAVNLVNRLINKHKEIFKDVDAYYDPYGGSLIYLNNFDILKNTNKLVYINISKKFEPYKYEFYKRLKSDDKFMKETKKVIQKMIEIAKKDKDKNKAKKETKEMLSHYPIFKEIFREYISENYPAERIKNMGKSFDSFVKTLRKKNVHILNKEDVDFYKFVSNHVDDGKRVVLFDDSDYANLYGEDVKSVYGDTTDVDKLIDRKKEIYDKIYKNNGIIITQNQVSPKYMEWLDKYNPILYAYGHWAQWGKHVEYGYVSPFRPEFIGIIKKGVEGNGKDFRRRRQVLEGTVGGTKREGIGRLPKGQDTEVYRNGRGSGGNTRIHQKEVNRNGTEDTRLLEDETKITSVLGGLDLRTGVKLTKDLIESTTVKITKSNFFTVYFIPPHLWQYAKNPIIRRLGKSLNEAKFDIERETLKYRKPTFDILDETSGLINEAKKKLGKDFNGFINAVSDAIVKGDIEQRNPKEIFKEKGEYLQYKDLADRLMENHKKFYDIWREGINTFTKLMIEDLKQNKFMSDEAIQRIEKYIYSQINDYPYYMHRQRDVGNVWVLVRNNDGKVVYREHVFDPLAWVTGRSRRAKKVLDRLKKKYGDNYLYEVTEPNFEDISKADLLSFIDVLDEVLHNSKISDEQRQTIFENLEKQIKSKGFMATSIHRSKNLIEGYNKSPFDVMIKYNAKASAFLSKQLLKYKLNDIYDQQHSLWDNRLKRAFKWHVNELMRNKNALDKVVGYTRGLMFLRYIALSLKNLFVNIVFQQPITLMHLSAEFGGKLFDQPKAFAVFNNAVKDLVTGNLSEKEKQILKQLDELRVTADQRTQFTLGRTALITGSWNRLMNYAGIFMKYSEIFNRKSAALSYMRAHPELSGDELLAKTRDFVYLTNGKYGDTELAVIFQGGGAFKTLGKIGQTFQTYNHQVLAGILKLIGEKQFISLLFGMGTLMFMGGLAIMPNYQAIKSFYTKLTGRDLEIDVKKYLDKYGIGFFKWFLDGGLMGNLPFGLGTDLSSSAALSMPFDDLNFAGRNFSEIAFQQYFGIGYQALKDMWKSIKSLQSGDYNKAIYYCPALPKAFGNIFKALHDYKWGLTTNGDLVIYDPFTNQPMKPTEKEAFLEALGFPPERLAQFKNIYYSFQSITQYFENQRKVLYNKYRTAVETGDKKMFEKVLSQLTKLNQKIQEVNISYGMSLPYANVHSARMILNNRNLRNFLYSNLGR